MLFVSPPFLAVITLVALSASGIITFNPRIDVPRRLLILDAVVYWVLAAILSALLFHARAAVAFVRLNAAKIAGTLVSLALSLIIAEYGARIVVARTRGFSLVPSPTLHHTSPPNLSLRDNTGSFVRTNADGLRSGWTRESFRTQHDRIAVIGDSFTFGLGVNDDETTPYFLEQLLRERLGRDDVGVLNAGTISWSPLIERNAFRDVVRDYHPTVTVLLLDVTDIGDDYKYAQDIVPESDPDDPRFVTDTVEPEPLFALLKLTGPIVDVLRTPRAVLDTLRGETADTDPWRHFRLEIDGVVETNRWFVLRYPLDKTRPYFEKTLSYARDIARDVRAADSEILVVVPPRYFQWNDRECPNDWNLRQRTRNEPYEHEYFKFFDEAAKKEAFPIISLLPAFQATDRFPLVLDHDAHWNKEGNRFVAETLADLLLERGLVR